VVRDEGSVEKVVYRTALPLLFGMHGGILGEHGGSCDESCEACNQGEADAGSGSRRRAFGLLEGVPKRRVPARWRAQFLSLIHI